MGMTKPGPLAGRFRGLTVSGASSLSDATTRRLQLTGAADYGASLNVLAGNYGGTGAPGVVVRGSSGQTGRLMEFQNSTPTALSAIASDGHFLFPPATFSTATAGSASLPAQPALFLRIRLLNGAEYHVPLYNTAAS